LTWKFFDYNNIDNKLKSRNCFFYYDTRIDTRNDTNSVSRLQNWSCRLLVCCWDAWNCFINNLRNNIDIEKQCMYQYMKLLSYNTFVASWVSSIYFLQVIIFIYTRIWIIDNCLARVILFPLYIVIHMFAYTEIASKMFLRIPSSLKLQIDRKIITYFT